MNRRDIFKALAVAPAAVLPKAIEEKPKDITIQIPAAAPPGTQYSIITLEPGKVIVFR